MNRVWYTSPVAAVGLGLLLAPAAWAQPGDHIRPNDTLTIVPRLDLAMEYRTNVYRDEVQATPASALRLSPGLDMSAAGPDHEFDLGGQWDLRKFLFVGDVETGESGPSEADLRNNLDRFNDFAISGGANLFKRSKVGFQVSDRVGIRNQTVDDEFADTPYTTQFRNAFLGNFRYSPTTAVSLVPGGTWIYDDFRLAGLDERYNARNIFGPQAELQWAFFPRTSLFVSGSYQFHDWVENVVNVDGVDTQVTLQDSRHMQVRGGLRGQVTPHVHLDLSLGYGTALYDDAAAAPGQAIIDDLGAVGDASADVKGLDGLLANAQLRYLLSDDSEVFAGFQRSFTDMFFTNFVVYNYAYAGSALDLDGWKPSLSYGLRLEEYGGVITRNDVYHRLNADLGYDVKDWAAVSAGTAMQARVTADSAGAAQQSAEYQDWNVHLVAHFTY